MAISLQWGETSLIKIVESIRQLIEGRSNAVGELTLRASQTTTTVSFVNCSRDSKVFLMPRTANAAAAVPTTWVSSVEQGGFTLTHANAATTDRDFGFLVIGG